MVHLLKAYEKYKESDTFGIKKIPVHWDVKRGYSLFEENRKRNSDGVAYTQLQFKYGEIVPKPIQDQQSNSDTYKKYTIITSGVIMINGLNLNYDFVSQRVAVSKMEGIITSAYISLNCRNSNDIAYLCYLLKGLDGIKLFHGLGNGLRQTLIVNELLKLQLPVPPHKEQVRIVHYLDWKISEMNRFINQKKKQVKLLEELKKATICKYALTGIYDNRDMQTSEYPWINKLPVGWKETRAKTILKKLHHPVRKQDKLLICSNSGKVFFRGDSKLGLVADSEDIYQGVRKGDLLIHGMDTWHGAIAISGYDGKCTPVVHVCDSSENKEYVAYYLRALAFLKVYKKISNGVRENTSDFRSWGKAGDINVLVPPRDEQDKIAEILNEKCKHIENIIASLEKEITFIEELKEKTIADVVTGKVDVRNVVVPDFIIKEEILEECDTMKNDEGEKD